MIKLLPNPAFLPWLLDAIARARRSVVLVNYLTAMGEGDRSGPVSRIAVALAGARRRGVSIDVVLEGSKFRENLAFYRFLKNAGADVWMDTSLTFIHTKAVLVDRRILCVGSHNLSASALSSHHELSIATDDRTAIHRFHQEFERMTEQRRRIGDAVCREGVSLAITIISPLVLIRRSISPHAYLLYLLLCRLDDGKPRPIPVDASGWVAELGLPSSVASAGVRVSTILDHMANKLKVVRIDRKRNTVCRLSVLKDKGQILIPDSFWNFGWHRRLSVEAIHLYFAGEIEKIESPFAPWWRLRRDEIAARYGFQKQLVNRAQMELRRAALLEVIYETSMAPKGRYARQMNYFRQNPFYDLAQRTAALASITHNFPTRTVKAVHRIASVLGVENDPDAVAALGTAAHDAGAKCANRALRLLKRLAPNSTRRTLEFALELLGKRLGKE